ncbi:hypothetical protein DVH05_013389 [Phytophthora capsici]|nr:hypothetical protein DVH05_013389 [Phytophthora capsici]
MNLHEFLDISPCCTLVRACELNSEVLARRIIGNTKFPPATWTQYPQYRQWQFEKCISKAVPNWTLEMVEMLGNHFTNCSLPRGAVEIAASFGRSDILQWMVTHHFNTQISRYDVAAAIYGGHLELAKWMANRVRSRRRNDQTMRLWETAAATSGSLLLLQWVWSLEFADGNHRRTLCVAVDNGHLEMVKWIMEQHFAAVELPTFSINLDKAAQRDHLAVIEWLIRNEPTKCCIDTAEWDAARKGQVELVKLLRMRKIRGCSNKAIAAAASSGHEDLVKWLHSHQVSGSPGNAVGEAVSHGFLDLAKWLRENTTETWTDVDADTACRNGHIDVVKWLHGNHHKFSANAMDMAASEGHLDVVQWLHFNRHEGCTAKAMDLAASNGYIQVVKWLSDNRTEGYTIDAMEGAAANGHLEVVKWLHTNTNLGLTARTMDLAVVNNQLETAKWISTHTTEIYSPATFDKAAARGYFEMVQWLSTHTAGSWTSAVNCAMKNSHFDVALFLHQTREECDVFQVLDEDTELRWQFAEWMFTHHHKEFKAMGATLFG